MTEKENEAVNDRQYPEADDAVVFPTLADSELAVLAALGTRRSVAVGEYLYREGDPTYDFYVILSGVVEVAVHSDGEERIIARQGPGRFLGELNLLTGERVYLSAHIVEPGEVLVVPRAALQHVIATNPGLGDTILTAFLARRRGLLSSASAAIRVVGSQFSPESLRIREFLARNRIPHEWLDPERDSTVERLLREFAITPGELPVVIASGSVLRHPTPGVLAQYLGLTTGISGGDLTQRAVVQAEKFGAHLTSPCAAASLREAAGHLVVRLSDGTEVAGRAVIVASGASYRRLDAARLADFEGNGVYYAATEMEARLCAGSPVVVVGGGNSAGQAALFLAAAGSPVTVVIRGLNLDASMSRYLVDRIEADARIDVRTNTKITGLDGDRTLTSVRVTTAGGDAVLPCVALFSFIGADPAAGWLSGCAALDARGFVRTDRSLCEEHLAGRWEALGRRPLPFETSYPGLFASGDVRAGSTKRVAAAVGEESAAVRSVHEYLASAQRRLTRACRSFVEEISTCL